MNREGRLAKSFYSILERRVMPVVNRQGWSADQISWAGLAASAASGLLFPLSPAAGGLFLLCAGLCDGLDGLVARSRGTASKAGAFLDSVLDRYGEIFVLLGIWGYLFRSGQALIPSTIAVFLAISGALLVSYTRARGEGLAVSCSSGLFQRGERILLLAMAGLLDILAPGAIMFMAVLGIAIGAHITAINRGRAIRARLLGAVDNKRR